MAPKGANAVDIDENNLIAECLGHPRATLEAIEDEADAKHELAKAESRLSVIEADLQLQVRKWPTKFELPEKPLEAAIKSTVYLETEYCDQVKKVNEAQHAVHLCSAMVRALEDKRRMIERVIELRQIDYWSEPRPRGESREVLANGTKTAVRGGVAKRTRERDDA